MAQANSDFELAWSALDARSATEGWLSIAIDAPTGASWRAGRRSPGGEESFLIRFSAALLPAKEALPQGQGFLMERVELASDGFVWLALSRKPGAGLDLFFAMARDVADTLRQHSSPDSDETVRALLRRVHAWQEFMRKTGGLLSPEQELGLFGELMTMVAMIDEGLDPLAAVEAWLGPTRDGVQDFEVGSGAVEAKTTLAVIGFPAHIRSLDQLDDSVKQPLYLAAVRLHQVTAGGLTLRDAIEETKSRLQGHEGAVGLFLDRLVESGYVDAQAELYTRRFELASMRLLLVEQGFPRLTRGSVPLGITDAYYEVDIDKAGARVVDLKTALQTLGVLQT